MGIALACNVYNDAMALRGLLETSQSFFDNIYIIHSGPGGAYSTDGTIELCQQFGIQPVFADINVGFGEIRSRLLHECGEEWAFIADSDERFFPILPAVECHGEGTWHPSKGMGRETWPPLKIVPRPETVHQGRRLRELIANPKLMAIQSTRRHWFDFTMKHPTQNWWHCADHQLRIVRNVAEIGYKAEVRMHERIWDSRTNDRPVFAKDDPVIGLFHDHFHPFFRAAEIGKKEWNESQYEKLSRGEPVAVRK